jgi:hypothetical protein
MADRPHILPQSVVDDALAMSDMGVSDEANAELHSVAVKTICRWRRDYQRREAAWSSASVHPVSPLR